MAKILSVNGNNVPDDFPVPLEGTITVKLETGRVVEMVIGELSMLYEMGEIPNDLTAIAVRTLFPPKEKIGRAHV